MEILIPRPMCWAVFLTLVTFVSCTDLNYRYRIQEDRPPPFVLGNIAQNVNLFNHVPNGTDYSSIQYNLFPKTYFQINNVTSEITVKALLDRDIICEFNPDTPCEITFEVSAVAGTFLTVIKVVVELLDLNDHAPYFARSSPLQLSISESSQVGTSYVIDSAIDKDATNFSIKNYRIDPVNFPFYANATKNLDGRTTVVRLVVKEALDREIRGQYLFHVIAEDGGNPPKTGSLLVNITIQDVNDNAPKFTNNTYNVTVKEDVEINKSILKVEATDPDLGPNGEVSYKISTAQKPEIQSLFSIESASGIIRVAQTLKSGETYPLLVEAKDNGNQSSSTQVFVYIHVENSRNNPPTIELNLLNEAKITEFAPNNYPVAYFLVIDGDVGINGVVTCEIEKQEGQELYFGIEAMDQKQYKVVVQRALDRETMPLHKITIVCNDHGNPKLSATSSFTAQVLDENDMIPEFGKSQYKYSIDEENKIGIAVAHVVASDKDIGVNANITYTLDAETSQYFTINPVSGVIYASIQFDREYKDQYIFKVTATDHGKKPLSSTTTVILDINDTNDNSPVFERNTYSASIRENSPIDSNVTQVIAIDKDLGDNGFVNYMMDPKYASVPFFVHPAGYIRTKKQLNREEKETYEFEVIAKDNGSPFKMASVLVKVDVEDENDNAPVVIFPNVSNDTVQIPYSVRQNSVVASIQAHDVDAGVNQRLLFSILERNDSDIFNVNSVTGEVILAKPLQKTNINKYFIQVVVSDQAENYLSTKTKLNLIITDTNTTAVAVPQTEANSYNVAIVVTVVVVTLVLSATILVTIFVIRRLDKQKRKYTQGLVLNANKMNGNARKSPLSMNSLEDGKPPLYSAATDSVGVLYSYATENALDRMSLSSNNTFQAPPIPERCTSPMDTFSRSSRCQTPHGDEHQQHQQSNLHRLASLRLQQALIQSQDKHFPSSNSECKRTSDDHNSDTSGETIPSDSGRGASEDEVQSMSQSHTSEELKRVHFQMGRKGESPGKRNDNYINMMKSPLNPYVSSISSGVISPRLHNELKHQLQPSPPHQQHHHSNLPHHMYGSTSSDIPSYCNFQRGLLNQAVDETADSIATGFDDDDNTTTSGSYTIDNEDFPIEIHVERPHDVFV